MTTGKPDLCDMIIEALEELGHEYQEYGSKRDKDATWQGITETLQFKVSGSNYTDYFYSIEVQRSANKAKFLLGTFPELDFHSKSSIMFLNVIALQMPTLIALRDIGEKLEAVLTPTLGFKGT